MDLMIALILNLAVNILNVNLHVTRATNIVITLSFFADFYPHCKFDTSIDLAH